MGCWNGTCALTQLAIGAGEPVRLIFIAESPYQDEKSLTGFCHPTDMYYPYALPIKGKYNDYGGIEKIEPSLNTEYIEKLFKKTGVEKAKHPERDKYRDQSFQKSEITLEYLLERAQEGHLYIHDSVASSMAVYRYNKECEEAELIGQPKPPEPDYYTEGNIKVGYVMIREDMYQLMLKGISTDRWNSRKKITLKSYLSGANEYLEELKKYAEDQKELERLRTADPEEFKKSTLKMLDNLRLDLGLMNGKKNNLFMMSLSRMNNYGNEREICHYDEYIKNKIKGGASPDSPEIKELVYQLAEFFFFRMCFADMRKSWAPQAGAGSQDEELTLHLHLAKGVVEYLESTLKRIREENAEYELEQAIDTAGQEEEE